MNRRHSRPLWMYALLAFVAGGALYLAFEAGRYQAGFSLLEQRRERTALTASLEQERAASEELRRQLAIAETGERIDRETYAQVKANLADLEGKIQAQEEELVFYRGIVSPQDGVAGLRIERFEVLPSDMENRFLLRLLLVQAIVHNRRVSGSVKITLEGVRDGQPVSLDAAELVPAEQEYDMAYQFRYFQGLEAELELPEGFEPARIAIEIAPSEARGQHINQTFEWAVVAG
jgi:hypothetical protein